MAKKYRSSKPTRKDAENIYLWCVQKYGRSKINGSYPELLFRKPDYFLGDAYGYYDPDEKVLYINKDKNKTVIDLIDTMIHEWTHYHQPVKSHWRKMAKEGRLDEVFEKGDPLEEEAYRIAKRDRDKCFKDLFS